jgi:hypothetical protein
VKGADISRAPTSDGPQRTEQSPVPRWAASRAGAGEELSPEQTRAALEEEHTRRLDAEERAERLASLLEAETERRSMAERQSRALAAQVRALDRGVVTVRRRRGPLRRLLRLGDRAD